MKVRANRQAPDGLESLEGPIARSVRALGYKMVRSGRMPGGIGFRSDVVDKWVVGYLWATSTESAFMNIIEQLNGNYEEAKKLWDGYDVRLKEFRNAIKNDVASLEASARKTTEAVQKMLGSYRSVIELMNSDEMQRATTNAERLATAMSALANLQSHKLAITIVDNAPLSREDSCQTK